MGSQLPFSDILCFQAPEASNQASVSASSEWQRKLEAAEALLAPERIFLGPFWLHLSAPALRCSR